MFSRVTLFSSSLWRASDARLRMVLSALYLRSARRHPEPSFEPRRQRAPGEQHPDRHDGTDHEEVVAEDRVQPHTLGNKRTPWLASKTTATMPVAAASTQTSACCR